MNANDQSAVQARGLHFAYSGEKAIFSGLEMDVPLGSVYGLLGANGIGKSTLMKALAGLLPLQAGRINLLGGPIRQKAFQDVGLLIEQPNIYPHLSGVDNLLVMATYRKTERSRVSEVLNLVGLEEAGNKQVRHYSTGMKQRLGIALAILHRPRLLLLDEPANGLDPVGIVAIRRLIRALNQEEGMTILLSSHLLSEVEQSCTHLGILARGRLAYQGSLEGARSQLSQGLRLRLHCNPTGPALDAMRAAGWKADPGENGGLQLLLSGKPEISQVIDLLRGAGIDIHELIIEEDRLEDFFLSLYQ